MPWDDDRDLAELAVLFPLRVHRHNGEWVCMCLRFSLTGKCTHLVPFLPKEDVEVSEEYL